MDKIQTTFLYFSKENLLGQHNKHSKTVESNKMTSYIWSKTVLKMTEKLT